MTILYNEKIRIITGGFLWIEDPDPVFSWIRIRVTQKDRILPDPDPIRIRNTVPYIRRPLSPLLLALFSEKDLELKTRNYSDRVNI